MKFNIFEPGVFSFNSYIYYLTRGLIASTRAFNLLPRVFNLPTRVFSVPTRDFNLVTRAFSLLTRGFELVTRGFELITFGFELVTRGFELVTFGFELVTRNSSFIFPPAEISKVGKVISLVVKNSYNIAIYFGHSQGDFKIIVLVLFS